mgnify:CR=1 FL=1
MARIALYKDNYADSTVVSNLFIDEYMKDANDAQLKVYFYLLRMLNAEQAISVSGKPCKHWTFGLLDKNVETVDIVDTKRRCIEKTLYIGRSSPKSDRKLSTGKQQNIHRENGDNPRCFLWIMWTTICQAGFHRFLLHLRHP